MVYHNYQTPRTGLEKLYRVVSGLFFYVISSSHTSKTGSQMPPPKVPAKRRQAPMQEVDDNPFGNSPLTEGSSPKPTEPTPRNKRQKTKAVGTRKSQRTKSQVAADS